MPKVVKKKKQKIRSFAGGGSSIETSSLRPEYIQKLAPCMDGCPNQTDIRGIMNALNLAEKHGRTREESYKDAWDIVTNNNPYPAVCGRVCPHPCESACNRKELEGSVGINNIERFIGDIALDQSYTFPAPAEKFDEKIAVIGAGPAGMSCAYQLAKLGYPVTVFEAFPKAGGMLRYGIPAYRLPREILDKETDRILEMGVELKLNTAVGKDIPYEDLQKEYKVIFVGIGAHQGKKLGLDGEDAENIWTGTDFLNKSPTVLVQPHSSKLAARFLVQGRSVIAESVEIKMKLQFVDYIVGAVVPDQRLLAVDSFLRGVESNVDSVVGYARA
ncbi:MAG: FAD-dependent oxidoreductase, partial [bacterium]